MGLTNEPGRYPGKQIFAATPLEGTAWLAISFASRLKSRCIDEQVRRMCITFRRPIKTENWAHETGGYVRPEADSCTAARMLFQDPVRAAGPADLGVIRCGHDSSLRWH